ncbi:XRE family transcriptional regulator (plasmid) [Brevibacillus halotolerans]|nr:XRE family transcriptional regulator [Brevibacillus halotolerans]
MKYSEMLSLAITQSGLKLSKIAEMVGNITGTQPTTQYLSRLQNGANPPGADKLNDALSQVLGIDALELKVAAYREKIPQDVLEKLQSDPKK